MRFVFPLAAGVAMSGGSGIVRTGAAARYGRRRRDYGRPAPAGHLVLIRAGQLCCTGLSGDARRQWIAVCWSGLAVSAGGSGTG